MDVLLEDISVNYCPVNNQPEDVYKYTFTYDTISPTQGRFYSRLLSIGLEQDGVSVNPTKIEWGNWEQYCHNFGPTTHGNIKDICYVGDFNGDGIDDMVSFPYTTQNDDHWVCLYGNGNGTFSPPDTSYYNKIESRDIIRIRPCDLNGDGLCDLLAETQEDHYGWLNNVIFSTVRLYAYITNSNGTRFANPLKIREYDTDTNHFDFIQIGDFWGDGQNKILALLEANGLNGHGIYAILLSYDWENNDYISVFYSFVRRNCSSVLPGDFNGDGRMEILMTDGDSSTTYSVDKIGLHELHASGFPTAWHKCFPGDFNGDGKTDLLTWAENANPHWHVSLSKTDGFFDQWGIASSQQFPNDEPSTSGPSLNVPAYNDFRYSVNVCDMDGDGKSDVIFVFNHEVKTYPSPVIYNTTNNTCSFIANKCIQNNPSNNYMYGQNRLGYNHIGKFKNDSHCSLLLRYDIYTPGQYLLESFDNQHKQNLVKSITDGMDNSVSFNYDYLTNPEFYTMSSGSRFVNINDGVRKQMIPLKALRYMTTENVSGTTDTTFYSYEDLYLHMTGRGILGFKKSTIINKTNGIKTVNTNRYAGHIRSNSAPLPFLVPDSSNTYLVHGYTDIPIKEISNSCILAAGHQILDQPYPVSVQAESVHVINHEINGDTINLEITEYEYDNNNNDYVPKYEYNNIIRIRKGFSSSNSIMQATACPFRVDTDITYHNAIGDTWLVSRVNKSCTSYLFRDLEGWHDIIKNSVQYTYDNSYPYLVKTEQVNPGDSTSSKLTLKTEYDYTFSNGNISSVQKEISAPNDATVQHRTSTLMFGPQYQYRFPTKTTNSMNHVATSTYDPKFGWKLSDTDCNGLTCSYANDFFGVDTKEVSPAGIQTHLAKRWAAGNADAPQNALYYTWTRSSGTYPSMTFYHKTGVPLRHVSYGVDGEVIYVDLEYDSKGNLHRKSLPYEAGGSPAGYVVYSYDGLNRVVLTEYPDGTSDEMDYNGNEISYTHHNANNTSSQTITKKYLPNGWLEETTDSGGNKVKYEYNSDGSLKSSYVDGSDAVVKLGYNSAGMRTSIDDPDYGCMSYQYNAFGEVVSQTTPKNVVTEYEYDVLGRTTQRKMKVANSPDEITTWQYSTQPGHLGTLASVTYNAGAQTITYQYDNLQRLVRSDETFDNVTYSTSYTYDKLGRVSTETYPSGYQVINQYNDGGCLCAVKDAEEHTLWQACTHDAYGHLTEYRVGNGFTTRRTFDSENGRLLGISTNKHANYLQNYVYTYDDFGNFASRNKNVGTMLRESFTYDSLNRLTGVVTNGVSYGMVYDSYGRMQSKSQDGFAFNGATFSTDHPHAFDRVQTYSQPPFGGQIVTYTPFDKVESVTMGSDDVVFEYGYDRQRIRMTETINQAERVKTYMGNCEFVEDGLGHGYSLTYLSSPDGIFAVAESTRNGYKMHYVHTDNLSSWDVITNEEGTVEQSLSFDAWGNRRNASTWSGPANDTPLFDRGFTGHEHLYNFGLINMNGRVYDPYLSTFLSPDNYIQCPDNSQNFNRYAYCLNNPLKYTDPDGEFVITTGFVIAAAAIIGAGIGTYQGYEIGMSQGLTGWDLVGKMALGGVIGAASGAASAGVGVAVSGAVAAAEIGGFWGGCIIGSVSGFIGGGINGYGMSRLAGNSIEQSLSTAVTASLIGMGTGALVGGVSSGIASSIKGNSFWNGKPLPSPKPNIEQSPKLTPKPAQLITSNEREIISRIVPDRGNVSYKYEYLQKVTGTKDIQHVWNRHSIEIVVDNGQAFQCIGNDGESYVIIQQIGNHDGTTGVFEMIFDLQNEVVTHQRFIPGGIITGYPNQITQQPMNVDYFKWW